MSDKKHVVLYTDGGFLLDSKEGGAGAHGYIHIGKSTKQQNIQSKWTPTSNGYVERNKEEEIPSVDIVNYIDIIKGLTNVTSSSESELNAINMALKWLEDYPEKFETITIYTDSQNIVSGITGWINKWRKNGWKAGNGKPVKFAELWQEVDGRMTNVRKTSALSFEWIKGHAGHLGNEKADNLATRGLILKKNGDDEVYTIISDYQSYWNPPASVRPPRLLEAPRMYTSTFSNEEIVEGKPIIYYTGSHGAKGRLVEEHGKVYPCNYLAVIRMTEPDPVVTNMTELVRSMEANRGGTQGTLITYNLQNMLAARFYSEALSEGLTFTERLSYPIMVSSSTGVPLAEEVVPIGRAFRLTDYCKVSEKLLNDIGDEKRINRQSILDVFFEDVKKKNGELEKKIRKEINSGLKSIRVDATFSTNKNDFSKDTFSRKLLLIIGTDLPSRNTLSAIAKEIESLDLISWRESNNSIRYGTYIKLTTGEEGVWTKYDGNLIVKPK